MNGRGSVARRYRSLAGLGVAAGFGLAVMLFAPTATPFNPAVNITAGASHSATLGPLIVSGLKSPSVAFRLVDLDTPSPMTTISCTKAALTGSAQTGLNQNPANAVKISAATFGQPVSPVDGCSSSGWSFSITATAGSSASALSAANPWLVTGVGTSNNPTPPAGAAPVAGQVTPVVITNVNASVSLSGCQFTVVGRNTSTGASLPTAVLSAKLTNSTSSTPSTLTVATPTGSGATLKIGTVTGVDQPCLGGFAPGHRLRLDGTYTLSAKLPNNTSVDPFWLNETP